MKIILSLLMASTLGGCVIREREVIRFKTLPAKVIEKVIMIVPDEPKMQPHPGDSVA